jgi:hypothetical protein
MAWLNLLGMAVKTGAHIYKNRQESKMLMSDAQRLHAEKMAQGQIEYQGKLLESRQSDWKDEFILLLLSAPIVTAMRGPCSLMTQPLWTRCNYFSNIFLNYRFGIKQFLLVSSHQFTD